jgi:hypothetical protein
MPEIHNQIAHGAVRNPIHIEKDAVGVLTELIVIFFKDTEYITSILLCQAGHQQVEFILVFVCVNTSHLSNSSDE